MRAVADPLRRAIVAAGRGPLADAAVRSLDRVAPRSPGVLTVLTYHRVDELEARPDLLPGLISATPADFGAEMAMVARDFDPVGIGDVLDALDRPQRLPRRAVLVTFDDGYRDFATNAWPIMRAASIPATLFVATAFASDPTRRFWWDRLWAALRETSRREPLDTPGGSLAVGSEAAARTASALRGWIKELDHDRAMREVDRLVGDLGEPAPPVLPAVSDWDELRRLATEGVALAPHTRAHPLLDRVPLERAVEEIVGSRADLEREIGAAGRVPAVLAYPSGAHGGSAVEAARAAGMTLAFTTDRGGNDLRRADPLRLRRINVGRRAAPPLLRAQMLVAATIDVRRRR